MRAGPPARLSRSAVAARQCRQPSAGMRSDMETASPAYRLVRQPAPAVDAAAPRRRSAPRGRARWRPAAGAGWPRHRQDDRRSCEAVVDRVVRRGVDPSRVLVLTFSRKAAAELRERITLRLGRTLRAAAGDDVSQLRLRAGAPRVRAGRRAAAHPAARTGAAAGGSPAAARRGERRRARAGRSGCGLLSAPRDSPRSCGTSCCARPSAGWTAAAWRHLAGRHGRDDWVAAGRFLDAYAARFDLAPVPAYDYAEIVRIAGALLRRGAVRAREREAYDVDPGRRVPGHRSGAGGTARSAGRRWPGTDRRRRSRTSRSTRSAARISTRSGGSPTGSAHRMAGPAEVVALRTCRRSGAVPAGRRRGGSPPGCRWRLGHRGIAASREHRSSSPCRTPIPAAIRIVTAASASQEAALIADTLRRAHLVDGIPWSQMAVLVRSAVRQAPALQRALTAAGIPVDVAGDELPLTDRAGHQAAAAADGVRDPARTHWMSRQPPSC